MFTSDKSLSRSARSRVAAPGDTDKSKPNYVVPDTDEDDDEDTVQSWTYEAEEAQDDSPTVEKVLDLRLGSPGAVGPATTCYSVEENGDPNKGESIHYCCSYYFLVES